MLFAVVTSIEEFRESDVDGYELRIDCLDRIDVEEIKAFKARIALPFIFTLRRGERFSEGEREAWIEKLLTLEPEYFDLEWDMQGEFVARVQAAFPKTKWIRSYHDFVQTPDLEPVFARLQRLPAAIYKIATHANSTLDALRMLTFVRDKSRLGHCLSGICMGARGAITRILGKIYGNCIDYAKEKSDIGQLSAEELHSVYDYRRLSPSTEVFGLIGSPVDRSIGHQWHNHFFRQTKRDAVYVKMEIAEEELPAFFLYARALGFKGLSVTMPLKEAAISYLDEINEEEIGSVNTIHFAEGRALGYNTDGRAALDVIEKRVALQGKQVAILGAGGAARAIALAAKRRGAEVVIFNRTYDRAQRLAALLNCAARPLDQLARAPFEILINCTPSPTPPHDGLTLDINYHSGSPDGLAMFHRQAMLQQEIWERSP